MGIKCYVCHKFGHYAKDCWYNKTNSHKGNNSKKLAVNKAFRKNWLSDESANNARRGNEKVFTLYSEPYKRVQPYTEDYEAQEIEKWTLDSGCSTHMTPREDWLLNKEPCNCKVHLAEEDRCIKAEAVGDIKISTFTDGVEH